jgi:hypothetical protein
MKRFCPDLVDIPFAQKSWSPLIIPNAPAPITKQSPSFFAQEDELASPSGRADGVPETVGRFAKTLSGFREQVISPDFTSLAPTFNVPKVSEFLGRKLSDFTDSKRTTMGSRVLAAHAWINDLETDRSGVHHKVRLGG